MCLQGVAGSIPQSKAKIIVFIKENFCTSAFSKKKKLYSFIEHFVGCKCRVK